MTVDSAPPAPQQPDRRSKPASPPGLLYTILRHKWGLPHEEAVRRVEAAAKTPPLAA